MYGFGSIVIEDNVIEGGHGEAIAIGELGFYALGTDPVVRNNTIAGALCGIDHRRWCSAPHRVRITCP